MSVTEAEFRVNVQEMFKALDMDRNDVLDWTECLDMVRAVMKQDGGYDAQSFKEKYKPKTHWQLEELRRYGL